LGENVSFDGYVAHHCVRPSALVRARGRHSGGITVLLRESSPYVGEGTQLRIHLGAATGILLVANDTYALTVAACYFSPANSNVYASGPGFAGLPAGSIPAARASQDSRVCAGALSFLLGLNSCGCVLLNGRAPGDLPGKATCFKMGVVVLWTMVLCLMIFSHR
jgi:hypothetical protein